MVVNPKVYQAPILLIFLITFPWLVAASHPQTQPDGPIVWVEDGMTWVSKDKEAEPETDIKLYSAKNEYEPFQIIVKAPVSTDLTNVNITLSNLKGESGGLISVENIDLYREHYLYVTQGSKLSNATTNPPLGPGWYPDALIPFNHPDSKQDLGGPIDAVPFDLKPGDLQPIWVDIYTPKDTPAGEYKGVATITSDQGEAQIQVNLQVWDFALPDSRSLKGFTNTSQPLRTRQNAAVLLDHRINPKWVSRSDERFLIDNYKLDMVHVFGSGGATYGNCRTDPPPNLTDLANAIQDHQPGLRLYTSYANEVWQCAELFSQFLSWAKNLRLAGIHPMIVTYPDDQLMGADLDNTAADIWSILPKHYDQARENIEKLVEHPSTEVWSYNPLVQDGYSPKFTIDFPLINVRILVGFINQSLGFTGTKFWRVDNWTANPWQNAEAYRVDAPGEGHMVYPGEEVGLPGNIIPGVRMKMFREGSEDFEYIQILKDLGQEQFALSTARSVGSDFRAWTQEKDELYAARKILGEKIHQLNSLPGSFTIGTPCWTGAEIDSVGSSARNKKLFGFESGLYKSPGISNRVPCY